MASRTATRLLSTKKQEASCCAARYCKVQNCNMPNPKTLCFFRSKLPHWLVADRTYFVTIRLKNTLPVHVIEELKQQQAESNESELAKRRNYFIRIEQFLDTSDADSWLLDNPEVAKVLMESLSWLESKGWIIYAAVILSTHVHLLMRNENGNSVELIKHINAYKSFTGSRANKILGKRGRFWAHDCFDHWIRSPEKFESTVRYIANNPVKAGRVKLWSDWPWVKVHDEVRYCLEP